MGGGPGGTRARHRVGAVLGARRRPPRRRSARPGGPDGHLARRPAPPAHGRRRRPHHGRAERAHGPLRPSRGRRPAARPADARAGTGGDGAHGGRRNRVGGGAARVAELAPDGARRRLVRADRLHRTGASPHLGPAGRAEVPLGAGDRRRRARPAGGGPLSAHRAAVAAAPRGDPEHRAPHRTGGRAASRHLRGRRRGSRHARLRARRSAPAGDGRRPARPARSRAGRRLRQLRRRQLARARRQPGGGHRPRTGGRGPRRPPAGAGAARHGGDGSRFRRGRCRGRSG